jgi:hypothetical protein
VAREEAESRQKAARFVIKAVICMVIGGCAGQDLNDKDASLMRDSVAQGPAQGQGQGPGQGRQGQVQQTQRVEAFHFERSSAEEVVQRFAELTPAGLPATAKMASSPREQLRRALYRRLRELGDDSVPALVRGLNDPDVLVKRNVVLFLATGQGIYPELNHLRHVRVPFPALLGALRDTDGTVRAWTAQAVGWMGPEAVEAVPALIALLASEDEGSRNGACIALRGIGPAARDALPALRQALISDPRPDVRGFARQAIDAIEGRTNPQLIR